ncbi:transposase [Fontibacillus sp. BL9]|uniref:transposase n=1 Tax=Fontibacillus sp. BL9 TaxID=3389971 RepID=UPI0039797F15
MGQKRKHYTEEFRRKTIEHLEQTHKTLTQLSRELDIGVTTLSNWKQLYGKNAKKDGGTQALVDYERMKKLEQQNRELQEENEILKKAMHFFTKDRD